MITIHRRILIGLLVFFILYTIVGFYVLPLVLKSALTKNLSESLNRQVTVEDIDTNPYTLSATLKGLVIKDLKGEETFSSLEELFINLQGSSVLKWALIVKEIRIQGPYVKIIRMEKQQYNFSDLMKGDRAKDEEQGKPFHFSLGNIQLAGGRIDLVDSPKDKLHELTGIALTLPFLSNIGEHSEVFVQPHFEATINGTRTVFEGRTKPFADTLETVFQINLAGIDIPYYIEYLPREIEIKAPSGSLDVQASISYVQYQDKAPVFRTSGTVRLKNLMVTDIKDLPIISLPQLVINIASSQITERSVHLAGIVMTSPEIHIRRDKTGTINLSRIVRKTQGEDKPEEAAGQPPFALRIDQAVLKGGTITFSDNSTTDPVNLTADNLEISARDISTDTGKSSTANLTCRLNRNGSVSAEAAFGIDPLFCDARISVDGLEPSWVQPYFTDKIRIIIRKGTASAKGRVAVKDDDKNGLQISYKGTAALADFASVDKDYTDEFVTWKNLSLDELNAGFNPTYIDIKEIALTDSFSRIIVNPDGNLNLNTIIRQEQGRDTAKPDKDAPAIEKILIEKISVKNANLSFLDRHIEPHYSTELKNIEGSIVGLTSTETKTAKVDLSAMLDNNAPLKITGEINPLKGDLFVDLHSSFTDIDLSPVSPYSGKFIGYTIQKGKLSLDLRYLIDKKKLDSSNKVYIDQFTFGNPVESPDATGLPVKFAVSLLKDPQGKIGLDLPVTGRTDDPEFRVGKIIFQTIANLIKKAATSPFSMLSAMYPGADELSHVEFEYGRATLPTGYEEKLGILLQILSDKPSVNLEIQGYADPEQDRQGLVQYFFEKKLKSQKLMDLLKKGNSAIAVDDISIAPDESERYLKKAYKAETFPKPTNALGLPKSLPAPEMKKLIIDHIEVIDSDLRLLAIQRAQQVKNSLIKSQKINPERIFLVEGQSLSPEKLEGVSNSRADLNLQ